MKELVKTQTKVSRKLPTLNDLYSDKDAVLKQNELNIILNADPKSDWLKMHPITKQNYLPIERLEYLLTAIFGTWNIEIKESKLIANSVMVTVRLYVKNPITGETDFQDGIGAVPIQIKRESGVATDFANMQTNAIQIAAPAAESYAFKDAAEKFGKIFGKDINRKNSVDYIDRIYSMMANVNSGELAKDILEEIEKCTNLNDLKIVYAKYKGLGKSLDEAVTRQKEFIESVATS